MSDADQNIDVIQLRAQVFAMWESVLAEVDQTDEGPEREKLLGRLQELGKYHHALLQKVLSRTTAEFASAASELENLNRELKASGDAVDKFAERVALVDKALGVLKKFFNFASLLADSVPLSTFSSIKIGADSPLELESPTASMLEMAPSTLNGPDRVWAIWTEGPYNARVRILYRHPTATEMCRVEGVHGSSYVHEDQLRMV